MTKTTAKSAKVSKTSKTSSNKSAKSTAKITKKAPSKKVATKVKKNESKANRIVSLIKNTNPRVSMAIIFVFGVLFIFSSYAWFSTNLNVKIKTFNMIVSRNSGLSISFDAINYDKSIEISEDILINKLVETYPNNLSQWAANGLIPISSPGITNSNKYFFDIYKSGGVRYKNRNKELICALPCHP